MRHSARIAPGISLQHPSDTIHNLPRDIQRHWPSISLRESARIAPPRFSRDIATSFSRDIHLERGPALSGHCEAGGRSQWKHFPSICTANMPHRYAWLVGGCADDCHEPDELFASTSLRHSTSIAPKTFPVTFPRESARIASGISLQYPSDNIRNLPRGIQWHCPTIST